MKPDQIIDEILRREGSAYTNHASDRGGPTKYGITQKTLSMYRGRDVTPEEVRALDEPEARTIYSTLYIYRPNFHQINDESLQALLIDSAVQHGPDRASKWLQSAAGVNPDGIIGALTIAAVNRAEARKLYSEVLASRMKFYGRLITDNPGQAVFAAGWMNRLAEFV
jgi:lysozyme family protein